MTWYIQIIKGLLAGLIKPPLPHITTFLKFVVTTLKVYSPRNLQVRVYNIVNIIITPYIGSQNFFTFHLKVYFWWNLPHFFHSTSLGNHYSTFCLNEFSFIRFHMNEIIQMFSLSHFTFIMTSGFIYVVTMAELPFYGWIIFHCICYSKVSFSLYLSTVT